MYACARLEGGGHDADAAAPDEDESVMMMMMVMVMVMALATLTMMVMMVMPRRTRVKPYGSQLRALSFAGVLASFGACFPGWGFVRRT